jgi:hypothetical protein
MKGFYVNSEFNQNGTSAAFCHSLSNLLILRWMCWEKIGFPAFTFFQLHRYVGGGKLGTSS